MRQGQNVEIKVESFPFTRYGTILGEVVHVSGDAVQGSEGEVAQLRAGGMGGASEPVYSVRIRLLRQDCRRRPRPRARIGSDRRDQDRAARFQTSSLWGFCALVAFVLCLQAVHAEPQKESRAKCVDPDPDVQIAGCTAVILSGAEGAQSDLVVAYVNRGNGYSRKGRDNEACADYNKALSLNPASAAAYIGRGGTCYAKKADAERAISDFSKAISLSPNSALAYENRCNAHYDKGQLDQAITDCNKALSLNPNDAMAYLALGKVYGTKGLYDDAVANMSKAIALDPKIQRGYYNRALAYQLMGRPENAIPDFDKAISLEPLNAKAIFNRAECLENLGRRDEAIMGYRATLKLLPGAKQALDALNRLGASPD